MAEISIANQCDILLKAEEDWNNSQSQKDMYKAEATTISALTTEQVGRNKVITSLEDPSMDDDEVTVVWIDNCETKLDDDCQDVCNFTGSQASMNSKKFKLTKCKSASFSIDENALRRSRYTLEEFVANQLLVKTKALDEYLNKQGLLFLSANAGYNKNQDEFTWNANSMEVPKDRYNIDLLVDMKIDIQVNNMADAFLIDNRSLLKPYMNAGLDKEDLQSGNFKRSELFKTYFDIAGFPVAGVDDTSFLVAPGSYAFVNRNYNESTPKQVNPSSGWQQRYSIPSFNVPGVVYDVYYKYDCSGKRFKHTYYMEVNYDFLLNPVGCGETGKQVSGILSYKKVDKALVGPGE
ncbi:hypothetical protein [Myroides odoratimimus]|uniref:hypothetical protein n=1 Tax=Myroides odoratimimus TaxID=76832 RepID=UPI000468B416|nr:hypothetical protein [Myroides odoratimimus]MDM1396068.1 hypothetical protein [Myroides odoratimimus]